MTRITIKEVEEQYQILKSSYSIEDWSNHHLLVEKAKEIATTNIPLAYRLMQRVKNLNYDNETLSYLDELKTKLAANHPELLESHSSNSPKLKRVRDKVSLVIQVLKNIPSKRNDGYMYKPSFIFIFIPFIVFAFYQIVWASPRFESRTQLIVKQPDGMTTLDPTMALLSGIGANPSNNDNELLKAYIYSNDMISYLESELKMTKHFSNRNYDIFSRLTDNPSKEELNKYFNKMVQIDINDISNVFTVSTQGFKAEYAQILGKTITQRAEWFINEIGHTLAKEQLNFVVKEHEVTERRLQKAKSTILNFQRINGLLDPEAEGLAFQRITYELEGKLAAKQAQLNALLSGMSQEAPQVLALKTEISSLENEMQVQRKRLTHKTSTDAGKSVGELLAKYSDLKIDLELALKAYASSQISLEKSRIEAYRQLKYLVVIESPTIPEDAKYPKVIYNIALFMAVILMLFVIGRIVIATVDELR
ncbi:lipopolysaccharide biosynthesis protein [Paraglaciecola chathamensis]|uniref:lipopolysaccharide biosynthesis protein n=1 Tax=Paraglaciecola chathamensis TaxID=368405 RepID=UPI0026F4C9CD|nr:lipopolysaccharide biosynthesis protein [Paraglaciecola chathamensis]MDO6838019.1 lipopolysaccharide biosynthesis protein [Paraglaciecola chathamensis]